MIAKYSPGLFYCEMVKMEALIRHDTNTYRILDYEAGMHPIGAQLCGSNPKLAGSCAKILEELGFDLIDLNCGCPVDKVTKDNSGSGLLRHPELIGEILSNMIAAVNIPITVKIRAGWDEESINASLITQIAEKAGAKVIFVHGRTRKQGYRGPAIWEHIKNCKEVARDILVFGNGDIVDPESAEQMFAVTGCDGLLLSRGTFGNPWIFEDIYRHFSGEEPIERTPEMIRDVLLEHIECITRYQPKRKSLLDLRRIGSWYLKKADGAKKLKEIVTRSEDLDEAVAKIRAFAEAL
ncbi:MAG: putative tRNA-dihydrouridine synthase [Chlamydiae bacterium]|nr:putative tRNA-dihydrouridine synthase [Chlamydiota bacterium]